MIEQVGRYEILEKIGEGGFAIVYRAKDTALDRLVALKELRPVLLNDADWVKRFHREAKTVAQLDHPHIVPIHDVYDATHRLFIVMRLIEGMSLDERVQKQGGLPWGKAIEIIAQIAAGLDYAHSRNILHRDLKPANILMDSTRGAMLTDFGLAKLTSQNSLSRSVSGTVVGTPHYIAPEVWEGLEFTPQADIYALGCIVYEVLTGERAFKGDTPPSIMMAHFRPPTLPLTWPSGVPNDIANIILKALASNPTDRYASAGELAAALKSLDNGGENNYSAELAAMSPRTPFAAAAPSAPSVLPMATPTPTDLMASHQELQVRLSMLEETLQREKTNEHIHPDPRLLLTADKRLHKRIGCFWGGMISAGIIMLLIIGAICSATDRITANLNSLVANFFPQVQVGELQVEDLEIPLPSDKDTTRFEVSFNSGILSIGASPDPVLVQGQARYNVDRLTPNVITDTNYIRLEITDTIGLSSFTNKSVINEWDLELGNHPLDLMIEANGANTNLELGGLVLEDVSIQQNLASATINFDQPNKIPMNHFQLNATGATIELRNLMNTQAETMGFNLGLGDYILNFEGKLKEDMDVEIEGGIGGVGGVTLIMPTTTNAVVSLNGKLTEVATHSSWQKTDDDEYTLKGDGPTIHVDVRMNVGNLTLETE